MRAVAKTDAVDLAQLAGHLPLTVGRYQIEGILGAGGMGVVLLASDPDLARQVALKVVRRRAGDRAYRDRLLREARAMAQLDHPNVVRVHDAGEADGELFVAMELVRGETLGAWMKAEPRPWREVVTRFIQAGRGLAAAHAAGLVHRDFKPDNVLVRASDGRVAVSDFGLAAPGRDTADTTDPLATSPDSPRDRADADATTAPTDEDTAGPAPISGDDSTIVAPVSDTGRGAVGAAPSHGARDASDAASPLGGATLTATGAIIGTPAYMAPEQAGGNPIDARADVYSFCVALHEGLYGARPFAITPLPGGGFARGPVTAKLDERDAPAALRKLVMRGLVTDPAQRWPAMAPVLEALAQLVGRRRRRLAVALSIATAAALGIGAYLLVAHAPTDACADQAARIASVWGPAQRDATRRALLASNLPYAPQATSAALDSLDHWAQAWRDARLSTCRAGERAVMPDDEARSRATCLDRLLAESIGRIGVLKTASPDVVQRALEIVTLPDASTCTIGQVDPPPRDATSTVLLAGFRDELAQIDTMVARDRHHDALARLRTLGERARQLDYPQIVDEIARRTIEAELATSEFTAASIPRVRDLGERFAARGQDATAAALWLDLIAMKTQAGDFAGLDETASAARVAALRCHDLTRKLRTEFAIGRLYLAAGKVSLAQTICENGLAATEGLHGETAVEGLLCVAACASAAATPELALRDSSRAFSEALALHGAKHPATLSVLRGIASLHDHLAHNVAATLLRESVAAAIAEQSGETSPDYASVLDDLSASYVVSGDKVRARAASDRAASIFASVPDNDARKISSRAIRAYVLQHVGDNAAALAESVQLADYFERTRARTRSRAVVILNLAGQLGAEGCGRTIAYATRALEDMRADLAPTMLIYLEMTRGNCRAQIGQWAETARDLDALWSQIDPSTLAPQERGMIEIVLANALYHVEAPADRVLDLFVRGRKDLDGARDPQELAQFDKLILEVRRWKARKDAAGPKHH